MKHLHLFESWGDEEDDDYDREDDQEEEDDEDAESYEDELARVSIFPTRDLRDFVAYHGTSINKRHSSEVFTDLGSSNGDYAAVWVTDEEEIAQSYADRGGSDADEIQLVYRVVVNAERLAEISYEGAESLMNTLEVHDMRDTIDTLNGQYEGWSLVGSIGYKTYDDIALFSDDAVQVDAVKLCIEGAWTDYIDVVEARAIAASKGFDQDE